MIVDYAPPANRAANAERLAAALRASQLARHGQFSELRGRQVLVLGLPAAEAWVSEVRIIADPASSTYEADSEADE